MYVMADIVLESSIERQSIGGIQWAEGICEQAGVRKLTLLPPLP